MSRFPSFLRCPVLMLFSVSSAVSVSAGNGEARFLSRHGATEVGRRAGSPPAQIARYWFQTPSDLRFEDSSLLRMACSLTSAWISPADCCSARSDILSVCEAYVVSGSSRTSVCERSKRNAIHLHDERPREGASSRRRCAQRHLALVSPRGENRRARPQRCRQELAAQDHGGRGYRVDRRSVSSRRHHGRLPASGATARSHQNRQE